MMVMVVITAAVRRTKLQSNRHH